MTAALHQTLRNKVSIIFVLATVGLLVYLPLWTMSIAVFHTQQKQGIVTTLPVLGGDSAGYQLLANNLAESHCFSSSVHCDVPETFRTPGYPAFIALISFFGGSFAVTFLQCILTLLTGFFLYRIARLYLSERTSMYVTLAFVLEPSVILYSLTLLSDISFTFLIVASAYLLLVEKPSTYRLAGIGVLLGLSALVRPISLFLISIYAVFYYVLYHPEKNEIGKSLAALCIGFALLIVPWFVRNKIETHTFIFSTVTGYNLFYYNVPIFLSGQTGQSIASVQKQMIQNAGLVNKDFSQAQYQSRVMSASEKIIFEYPVAYTIFHVIKTIPFFLSSSIENAHDSMFNIFPNSPVPSRPALTSYLITKNFKGFISALHDQGFIVAENFLWLTVTLLAFASVCFKPRRRVAWFLVVVVLYFGILTGPVSSPRYRVPAEPFLFLAAALSISGLMQSYKKLSA